MVQGGHSIGIRSGFVAMSARGLVGRIVESGQYYSRLMLLTDYLSRLPVTVGEERALCILSGDNSIEPKLISLPEEHNISVGDVVMTSGHVGLYPAGLGVGVVSRVDNGEIRVELFENNPNLTFIRLVDFGLTDVLLSHSNKMEK
jgi:rod shape-determining protein MreC